MDTEQEWAGLLGHGPLRNRALEQEDLDARPLSDVLFIRMRLLIDGPLDVTDIAILNVLTRLDQLDESGGDCLLESLCYVMPPSLSTA